MKRVTFSSLPVFESMEEHEEHLAPKEKTKSIIGCVDNLKPGHTIVKSLTFVTRYLIIFERACG